MKEWRSSGLMCLMTVPPFTVLAVSGNTFSAGSARIDASSGFTFAADTTNYHIQIVKEGCRFPDSIHYLPNSITRICVHRILIEKKSMQNWTKLAGSLLL